MGTYKFLQMSVILSSTQRSHELLLTRLTGICFGTKNAILRLDVPDNPSKPCLSCTKQWCLNQNLPICAGASLGDTDPDTATGKEGDVEARCFRTSLENIKNYNSAYLTSVSPQNATHHGTN